MLPHKLAISTISLGQHPSHALDRKIKAAALAGYSGIELVFSDLEAYSRTNGLSIFDAAYKIKQLCESLKIEIISLAPFENYEGDRSPLGQRLQTATLWIGIARIIEASYLQVPSQFKPDAIGDESVIVSDLQQLADLGTAESPIVSIAYEALSWGTYFSTWESTVTLAEKVNRSNFGLCLDTFHIVTKLWADPFVSSGKFPEAEKALQDTLDRFVKSCPMEKVFYVQLSDGEKFDPPFSEAHSWYTEGEAHQFTWSKYARPFPGETDLGGYMPVNEIVRAWIVEKGYKGWVSMEVFDRRMRDENSRPEVAAARGVESWEGIQKVLKGSGAML
ncbi:AP endonuclease family 2 [Penicillium manginii]|uniref:AP endonuclease family 2 n=1 Tax=Penicillium manginii TaxID=203109 RepID=UPI0025483DD3|nr:AP endonuclease family 2 [Penicillium manginii]KAJ5756271.1 AP endonuclease family 2 [Penicillium manginii]